MHPVNEAPDNPAEIPKSSGGCLWVVVGAAMLLLLGALLFPSIAWTGGAWLAIDIRLTDAATDQPVTNATVTLFPDPPAPVADHISSPTVLTAITDTSGRATLKHLFGAGGGNYNTTIVVRASVVRCEAPGYVPSESRVAQAEKIRFQNFPFFAPRNHKTELSITLSPQ